MGVKISGMLKTPEPQKGGNRDVPQTTLFRLFQDKFGSGIYHCYVLRRCGHLKDDFFEPLHDNSSCPYSHKSRVIVRLRGTVSLFSAYFDVLSGTGSYRKSHINRMPFLHSFTISRTETYPNSINANSITFSNVSELYLLRHVPLSLSARYF